MDAVEAGASSALWRPPRRTGPTEPAGPVAPPADSVRSDANDAVELLDQARELRRRDPASVHPAERLIRRPTGDRARLSDVDRDLVVDELSDQIARGRDADALDSLGRLLRDELRGIADENDRALLIRLHGAVRSDVERNRCLRRVADARRREVENLHPAPPPGSGSLAGRM